MVDFWDKGFKDIFDIAAEKFRQQTHDDLQNEIAGRSTGRMKRFFIKSESGAQSAADEENEDALSALQLLLLNDPVYAALYADTFELLERAEAATAEALGKAETSLAETQAAMDDILARAGRMPDSTAVFEDRHGNIFTENGDLVEANDLAAVIWKDGVPPSYEDYLEHKEAHENAKLRIQELKEIEADLGETRNRLEDQETPVKGLDKLEDINKGIQNKLEKLTPEADEVKSSADNTYRKSSDIVVPELGG